MAEKFINIAFPFSGDEDKGRLLSMNNRDKSAIKSDILHLLLTNKGERLYLPDFGANLRRYIFEPNDSEVSAKIRMEIQSAINKFIPNLKIDSITTSKGSEGQDRDEHHTLVRLEYTVTDAAFQQSDSIEIQL